MYRNALVSLLGLAGLAGTIWAIIMVTKNRRPGMIWWIIAIVLFPLGWLIYLILEYTLLNKQDADESAKTSVQVPGPGGSVSEVSNNAPANTTGAHRVFKTIGVVLATIAIIGGALVIGFIILIAIALSSYGSNK